jgi:hypothetical protein
MWRGFLNGKEYKFYGYEAAAAVKPLDGAPAWLKSAVDLYDALSDGLWCVETCAPRLRPLWSSENKTCGQCSITAFLVQDLFGGEVYGIPREGGTFHCYNVVDGKKFDLTSEQFGDEAKELVYDDKHLQSREIHFAKTEKKERYEVLKSLVERYRA